jgi:hypothetical protein
MEIVAVIAVLLLLVAGPVIAVNRDLLFHRSDRKRSAADVPLPFLIIPSYPGAANIVPAGVARPGPSTRQPQQSQQPQPRPQSQQPQSPQQAAQQAAQSRPRSQWADPHTEQGIHTHVDKRADLSEELTGGSPQEFPGERPSPSEVPFADLRQAIPHELSDGMDESFPDELDEEPGEVSSDATVVFHRPVDEPVQILPGRLRILSGEAAGEDLRLFSRIGEPPQIVVGRETGPPHRHITLHSPTVSRRHARMDFADGHWTITNLSRTNPVLVNDRVLANGGSSRKLSDGDRIELGEVALRFLTS